MAKEKECKCIQDMIAENLETAGMKPSKAVKEDKKK